MLAARRLFEAGPARYKGIRGGRRILLLFAFWGVFFGKAEAKVLLSIAPEGICWSPRIAIDTQGNIHVIWLDASSDSSGDIFYSYLPAGGRQWRTPVNLSNSGRVACESKMACGLGLDGSQRLYVAWGEIDDGIKMRILTGGSWGAVEQVASFSRPDMTRLAVDSLGNLFFIWYSYGTGEVFSQARVGGSWEGTERISNGRYRSKFPDIAVNNGTVYAVFTENSADYQTVFCRRSTYFRAAWSEPRPVYTEFPLAHHHPSVEVDSNGVAHVAYIHVLPDDSANGVMYSRGTDNGFSTPFELSGWSMTHWPFTAVRNNIFYVVWQEGSADWGDLYYRGGAGEKWSSTQHVPDSGGAVHMDLALDPAGNLGFVWSAEGRIYYGPTSGGGGGGGGVEPPRINQPPVARFNFSPSVGFAPVEIQFDGMGSYDPDGTVAHWDWLFGDGATGSGGMVFHTFQKKGLYQVKLTVVDNEGLSASVTQPIEILGINPPLNVRWTTFADESIFMSRYVTEVRWEGNPDNDRFNIAWSNIYRRKAGTSEAWTCLGRTAADVFLFLDKNVKTKDFYAYTVTAVDDEGHESPIGVPGASSSVTAVSKIRTSRGFRTSPRR